MSETKENKEVNEKNDPLERLLKGERIIVTKKTRRGNFTIVFPLPSDLRKIELLLADRLGGKPVSSFASQFIDNMRAYATLDVVVVDAPAWWKKLSSAEECADDKLITDLYRSYLRHYNKTQRLLAEGEYGQNVGKIELADETEVVDSGTFSGIANG